MKHYRDRFSPSFGDGRSRTASRTGQGAANSGGVWNMPPVDPMGCFMMPYALPQGYFGMSDPGLAGYGYYGQQAGYPVFPYDDSAFFERLSLNPDAKEFDPNGNKSWSKRDQGMNRGEKQGGRGAQGGAYQDKTVTPWRGSSRGRGPARSSGDRNSPVQKGLESNVKRTVYICDVDQRVTEEQLATAFKDCGTVVDCRVCGDPNSAMRFAFIEFSEEAAVKQAITMTGTMLGKYPIRVLPSKTAIVPVNNTFLPRSREEREKCARTVYAANIDKQVEREDVRSFFESLCGPVAKIRLLGDLHHNTRIAFVEFEKAESARAALNCTGALLGSLPLRVSPSKTPVRTESNSAVATEP